MRLITYQNKDCLKVINDGIWYSTKEHRMKCIDYDYMDEDNDRYPIYTFASTGMWTTPCFGLSSFFHQLCNLSGYMQFNLDNMAMVELEVPEDFILNLKKNSEWFEQKCDENDPDREKYNFRTKQWVKRDLSKGPLYTSDYLKVVRENRRDEWEALIPCLKKEHVAAIRTFECSGGNYDTTKCETIYTNDSLFPLWYGTVYLNGDGYARIKDPELLQIIDDLKAQNKMVFEDRIVQAKQGAKLVPVYYTIEEALACGNKQLTDNLRKAIKANGWTKDDIKHITLLGERV